MPEAGLDVEAATFGARELPGDREVDDDAGGGCRDHRGTLHRRRRREPQDRLEDEHRREHEQGRRR